MKKKLLFLLILLFSLTGCSNYHELNDLAIVSAVGIEKEDNKYKVTLELYKEVKESNSGSASKESIAIEGTGKSIDEAINNSSLMSEKLLYFSHVQAIVIDGDLAKEGVSGIMDYLSRNTDFAFTAYVVVTDGDKPNDILNKKDIKNEIIGDAINALFNTTFQNNSNFVYMKYYDFLQKYITDGRDTFAPIVKVKDKKVAIEEMVVFKDDKVVKKLDSLETKAFSLLLSNMDSLFYKLTHNDGYVVMRVFEGKSNIKIKDDKIVINVKATSDIDEANCEINTLDDDIIEKLNKQLQKAMKNDIEGLIETLKDSDSDALGLNEIIYETYGEVKKDWKDYEIEIKIKNNTTKKGLIMNPVRGE